MSLRDQIYRRDGGDDGGRCIVCGRNDRLSLQHRQGRGMGGDPRGRRDHPANLITMCSTTNSLLEHDLQALALLAGWKVPRLFGTPVSEVPVWFAHEGLWVLLDDELDVHLLSPTEATRLRAYAYGSERVAEMIRNAHATTPVSTLTWRCP